ncbi:helix-turn-helix domain-containing protein [Nonomuraea sp. NPDC049637]|uniref:helix-turn-helix domain-containing protein n=1 Tax=Nonomuraea sp. NPDC049637 TaxID=3154356 RepID=UPI003425EB25
MQGLLLRLSTLDTDAESAVRVIAYFDSLVRDHVTVPVLLAATARLARCPVGLHDATTGRRLRTGPDGRSADTETPRAGEGPGAGEGVRARELSGGLGSVWMEREGAPHGLDDIVLERFAAAAELTLERAAAQAREGRDPALVELVLSAETGEAERARALRLLGFAPSTPLQAMAFALPRDPLQVTASTLPRDSLQATTSTIPRDPLRTTASALSRDPLAAGLRAMGHRVRTARIGDTQAVLVATTVEGELPEGARVGIGPELPGSHAAESWAKARTALRFTGPHDRVVRWTDLGALALFADLPGPAVAELADVRAMARLSEDHLLAVRALCSAGSVRAAATGVHLHHSSMAARIARAESVLGFSLADPAGRLRAHLALALLRLLANATTAEAATAGAANVTAATAATATGGTPA